MADPTAKTSPTPRAPRPAKTSPAKTTGGNRAISWDPSATTGRHWRRLEIDERLRTEVGAVEPRVKQYTASDAGSSTADEPGGD